jgi:hypothetical protein
MAALAAANATNPAEHYKPNEKLLTQWVEDKRMLSSMQSMAARAEAKLAILPAYAGFITGILSAQAIPPAKEGEMLFDLLVWHLDAQLLPDALPLVELALSKGLEVPDKFKRQLAVIIADEVADQAVKSDAVTPATDLQAYVDLLTAHDMPDEVRAKLLKSLGMAYERDGDAESALSNYQTALSKHDKCGVKKDIERLEREIKKQNTGADVTPPAP